MIGQKPTPAVKRVTMWTGAILGLAAVFGLTWTAVKPHLESELEERFVTVETQSVLIEQQAEVHTKLWADIEERTMDQKLKDLELEQQFNEYRQEELESIPAAERTPRERVRLRGLIREYQLLLEEESDLENAQ